MNFLETEAKSFAYFEVQNLSIDHSLIMSEIDEYKDLIFSPNNLQQIYIKDSCDLESIELIKNLLSISEYIDDSKIDKYILIDLSKKDIDKLLLSSYENPSTWQLPYEKDDDNYSLIDIPNFRTLNSFIKKLFDSSLSPLELIMRIYDEIKLFDFDNDEKNVNLPSIITNKRANSYGMNKLFSYILNHLNFKTFMGETYMDGDISYVTLVDVVDDKYGVDGIYLFDPSMDSLPKKDYSSDDVRKINYNFFGIPLINMTKLNYDEKLMGLLQILAIEDSEFSKEKFENIKSRALEKRKKTFLNTFNSDFNLLYDRIKNSKDIGIDTIISVNDSIYRNKKDKYNDYLKENYTMRKKELFEEEISLEIQALIEEEKSK